MHRLELLVASRPGSVLDRVQDARWERPEWLLPCLPQNTSPTLLVTTNLDSDDGLDRHFTASVRDIMVSKSKDHPLPPVVILGYRDVVQWYLTRSRLAPFGWKSNWDKRNGKRLISTGLTVVASYPNYPVLVTGLRHVLAHKILDLSAADPESDSLYSMRRHACAINSKLGGDLESWPASGTVVCLDDRTGLPLVLNHTDTIQPRFAAKKPRRRRVWRARSFPNVAIDWERIWR